MILETFAIFFTFATPTNPLPDLEIGDPQGALALATAAASLLLLKYNNLLTLSTGGTFPFFIP
jgi:hypothetical protein